MFELTVQCQFRATHALLIRGRRETPHEHDWGVRVAVVGCQLDEDGLLCDFHDFEGRLLEVVEPFRGADLHRVPPFDRVNPTAERVAEYIGQQMVKRLPTGDVSIAFVSVTEAPGCTAIWRPDETDMNPLNKS